MQCARTQRIISHTLFYIGLHCTLLPTFQSNRFPPTTTTKRERESGLSHLNDRRPLPNQNKANAIIARSTSMLVWMMMMNVCGEQTERVALFFFLPPLPPKNGKRPFSSVRNANDSVKEKIRDVRFPRRHTRTILSPERPFPVLNSLCISRLFIQVAWVVASLYCVNTF